MTVRMKSSMAGPNGAVNAGSLYTGSKQEEKTLVDGGYAAYVKSDNAPSEAAREIINDSALQSPEKTTLKRRRRKG